VADLSAYLRSHPVANPEPDDFEPDGTLFTMALVKGHFYAVEPNHGEVIRVNPGGHAERLIDISATQGHVLPTAIAFHNGFFYVGTLSTFPIAPGSPGSANFYKISESGKIVGIISGLTTVTGLAFDAAGRLSVRIGVHIRIGMRKTVLMSGSEGRDRVTVSSRL
jgi:hypothetical protein